MERYTVAVISPAASPVRLVVPFDSSFTLRPLLEEIQRRAIKQGVSLVLDTVLLRLGREDGPILDAEDVINHVVISPQDETIFVMLQETRALNQETPAIAVCPLAMPTY